MNFCCSKGKLFPSSFQPPMFTFSLFNLCPTFLSHISQISQRPYSPALSSVLPSVPPLFVNETTGCLNSSTQQKHLDLICSTFGTLTYSTRLAIEKLHVWAKASRRCGSNMFNIWFLPIPANDKTTWLHQTVYYDIICVEADSQFRTDQTRNHKILITEPQLIKVGLVSSFEATRGLFLLSS